MRLYIAGIYASNFSKLSVGYSRLNEAEKKTWAYCKWKLESYHYIKKRSYVDMIRRCGDKLFLDSGAFSAHTTGVTIRLEDYARYVKEHNDFVDFASVLDAIGDPMETWHNFQRLNALGVPTLPCFHYGEDERWLIHYIENFDFITIGGMVGKRYGILKSWLDGIWHNYLTDDSGRPRVKVHGFGLTSARLMLRYPWFSVDSTSWVRLAAFGGLMFPGIGVIAISSMSPSRKLPGQHYDNLPPIMQRRIADEIEKRGGSVERMRTFNLARWAFNIQTFNELVESKDPDQRFFREQPTLF